MSGAEVIAVVGAVSSVVTIWETCTKILNFIKKCQATELLVNLGPQVHLLANDIEQLKTLDLNSPLHTLLSAVLRGCEKPLIHLSGLLQGYHQALSLSRSRRLWKALKVPKWESEIQKTWTIIGEFKSTITLHLFIHSTKRLLPDPSARTADFSLFLVPHQRQTAYAWKDDIFDRIAQSIFNYPDNPCLLTLTGEGGVGKTRIARELCYRSRDAYAMIVWIDGKSESAIRQGILGTATALSGRQKVFNTQAGALAYLQDMSKIRSRPWMIVLDNCDFSIFHPQLFDFLAVAHQRDVVITTQRTMSPWGLQIEIPLRALDGAKQLLLHNPLLYTSSYHVEAATQLAVELDDIPGALHMASWFMKVHGMTPREYLVKFQEIKANETFQAFRGSGGWAPFYLTFRVALGHLQEEDPRLVNFMLQLSVMGPVAEHMFRDYFFMQRARGRILPPFFSLFTLRGTWNADRFLACVLKLSSYGLLSSEIAGEACPLVLYSEGFIKRFLRSEALAQGLSYHELTFQATAMVATSLATKDWDDLPTYNKTLFYDNIFQVRRRRRPFRDDPILCGKYSGILEGYETTFAAFIAFYQRDDDLAENILLESLKLQNTCLGASAAETCTTMTCLALLYLETMKIDLAGEMIDRLHAAELYSVFPNQKAQVDTLLLRAHLEMRKQNLDGAMVLLQECTKILADTHDIPHLGAACILTSSAEVLLVQGNLEEATQNLYHADCIYKLVGGPRSLDIRIRWNLARLSLRRGDYSRAIMRYGELIEEHQSNYEFGHPRSSILYCELGDVYRELGNVQNAQSHYQNGGAGWLRQVRPLSIEPEDLDQWLLYGSLERTKCIPIQRS